MSNRLKASALLWYQSLYDKLRVYIGKTENHRGTPSLFSSNFRGFAEKITRKQRDRSEMIRDTTKINWVCAKRVSGRIYAVYDKHSIFEVG